MDIQNLGSLEQRLDFAYRYPFSKAAKGLVLELNPEFSEKYLREGVLRLRGALNEKSIHFARAEMHDIKLAYLMSYVYARMVASALNEKRALFVYVTAEAARVSEALLDDNTEDFMAVAEELDAGITASSGSFAIRFENFLKHAPDAEEFNLSRQALEKGFINMSKAEAARFIAEMARQEMMRGLPIPLRELPKAAVEHAKSLRQEYAAHEPSSTRTGSFAWVERLLAAPIPDIRHRAVYKILAPYLVNVKGLPEEEASAVIINYIERCKELDPNTRITPEYIKYQCRYARERGLRPLSLAKAKELLGSVIDVEGL